MRGNLVHFLTHTGAPVAGCDACTHGAPHERRTGGDKEIIASMADERDKNARAALVAIISSSPPYVDPESAARMAYKYADAMAAARGALPPPEAVAGRA